MSDWVTRYLAEIESHLVFDIWHHSGRHEQ